MLKLNSDDLAGGDFGYFSAAHGAISELDAPHISEHIAEGLARHERWMAEVRQVQSQTASNRPAPSQTSLLHEAGHALGLSAPDAPSPSTVDSTSATAANNSALSLQASLWAARMTREATSRHQFQEPDLSTTDQSASTITELDPNQTRDGWGSRTGVDHLQQSAQMRAELDARLNQSDTAALGGQVTASRVAATPVSINHSSSLPLVAVSELGEPPPQSASTSERLANRTGETATAHQGVPPAAADDTEVLRINARPEAEQAAPVLSPMRQALERAAASPNQTSVWRIEGLASVPDRRHEAYELAVTQALAAEVGVHGVTAADLKQFQQEYQKARFSPETPSAYFGLYGSVEQIEAQIRSNKGALAISINEQDMALLRERMPGIIAERKRREQWVAAQIRESQRFGEEGLKRFAAMHVDVPVEMFNRITEPVRGGGNALGVEVPEAPTISPHVRSEYFDKIDPNNTAPRAAAAFFLMRAAPAAVKTVPGQVAAGVEAGYNIIAGVYGGVTGQNIAEKRADGSYEEMGPGEATLRVVGGVVGLHGLRGPLKQAGQQVAEAPPTGQAVVTDAGAMFPVRQTSGVGPASSPAVPGPGASAPAGVSAVGQTVNPATGANRA